MQHVTSILGRQSRLHILFAFSQHFVSHSRRRKTCMTRAQGWNNGRSVPYNLNTGGASQTLLRAHETRGGVTGPIPGHTPPAKGRQPTGLCHGVGAIRAKTLCFHRVFKPTTNRSVAREAKTKIVRPQLLSNASELDKPICWVIFGWDRMAHQI